MKINLSDGAYRPIQVEDVASVHSMATGRSMHVQILRSDADLAHSQMGWISQVRMHQQLLNLGQQILY